MIAKCVALLAVVAQLCYVANADCVSTSYGTNGVIGSGFVGTNGVVGSGIVGTTGVVGSGIYGTTGVVGSGVVGTAETATSSRNIVARGKYPVALDNNGPVPDPRVPVSTSHVQAPLQEKPTIRLPARIPAPRTVAHSCTCYKTIMRPRVHDQYITVPTVQRYIETTHKPVVENIHYEAIPVNSPSTLATSGAAYIGGQVASATPVTSTVEAVPVASSVGAFPVSTGYSASQISVPVSTGYSASQISAVPVSTGYGLSQLSAVPVSSSVQLASVYPYSTGCQTSC